MPRCRRLGDDGGWRGAERQEQKRDEAPSHGPHHTGQGLRRRAEIAVLRFKREQIAMLEEENVTDPARLHADLGTAREPCGEGRRRLLGGS